MPLRVPLQRFDERLRRLRPLLLRARRGLGRGPRRRGWLPRGRLLDRGEQVPERLRRQNRVIRQPHSKPLLRPEEQLHARQRVQPRVSFERTLRRQRARFPPRMKFPRQFERELEKRRFPARGRGGMRSHVRLLHPIAESPTWTGPLEHVSVRCDANPFQRLARAEGS